MGKTPVPAEPIPGPSSAAQSAGARIPADAELGIAWYNRLSRAERLHWHRVASSAVPADAWRAFQAGRVAP